MVKICGLQKTSLIDFPGKVAATVFLSGCNWRCVYCYNLDAVNNVETMPVEDFFSFLETRKGKLQGVVVSGGEPTVHPDLAGFIKRIRAMGFLVKLDTNGSHPEVLEKLLKQKLLDYVAMDVKAPFEKYEEMVSRMVSTENLQKSIALLKNSGIEHEFRTTAYSTLTEKDFLAIGKQIEGAQRYFLQGYRDGVTLAPDALPPRYTKQDLEAIAAQLKGKADLVSVRA